jgi:hypothetical protein
MGRVQRNGAAPRKRPAPGVEDSSSDATGRLSPAPRHEADPFGAPTEGGTDGA